MQDKIQLVFGDIVPFGKSSYEHEKGTVGLNNEFTEFFDITHIETGEKHKWTKITIDQENLIKLKERIDIVLNHLEK